jgi:hypothetical protein
MYKVIGTDGREYGPISAEQLRQWIAERRADGQTQVQPEGSTEWRPLSELPEFAAALAAQPPAPGAPLGGGMPGDDLAAQVLARGYNVDVGACFSRSWDLFTKNLWMLIGVTLLVFVIIVVLGWVPIVGLVAAPLLSGVLLGGLYWFYLKLIRGEEATVADAFVGFSVAFVQLMLAGLVTTALTSVGLLLCLVPGVYLMVAWIFTLFLVIDKKMEFWPAMETSRKVVNQQWWSVFALALLAALVFIAGGLAFGIGIALTGPLAIGAVAYLYEDVFGGRTTPAP